MSLHPNSRAYDPNYQPTKSLAELAAENPQNQFLQDRLSEQQAAIAAKPMTRTQGLLAVSRKTLVRLRALIPPHPEPPLLYPDRVIWAVRKILADLRATRR
jgi:hypothetical protein